MHIYTIYKYELSSISIPINTLTINNNLKLCDWQNALKNTQYNTNFNSSTKSKFLNSSLYEKMQMAWHTINKSCTQQRLYTYIKIVWNICRLRWSHITREQRTTPVVDEQAAPNSTINPACRIRFGLLCDHMIHQRGNTHRHIRHTISERYKQKN